MVDGRGKSSIQALSPASDASLEAGSRAENNDGQSSRTPDRTQAHHSSHGQRNTPRQHLDPPRQPNHLSTVLRPVADHTSQSRRSINSWTETVDNMQRERERDRAEQEYEASQPPGLLGPPASRASLLLPPTGREQPSLAVRQANAQNERYMALRSGTSMPPSPSERTNEIPANRRSNAVPDPTEASYRPESSAARGITAGDALARHLGRVYQPAVPASRPIPTPDAAHRRRRGRGRQQRRPRQPDQLDGASRDVMIVPREEAEIAIMDSLQDPTPAFPPMWTSRARFGNRSPLPLPDCHPDKKELDKEE